MYIWKYCLWTQNESIFKCLYSYLIKITYLLLNLITQTLKNSKSRLIFHFFSKFKFHFSQFILCTSFWGDKAICEVNRRDFRYFKNKVSFLCLSCTLKAIYHLTKKSCHNWNILSYPCDVKSSLSNHRNQPFWHVVYSLISWATCECVVTVLTSSYKETR